MGCQRCVVGETLCAKQRRHSTVRGAPAQPEVQQTPRNVPVANAQRMRVPHHLDHHAHEVRSCRAKGGEKCRQTVVFWGRAAAQLHGAVDNPSSGQAGHGNGGLWCVQQQPRQTQQVSSAPSRSVSTPLAAMRSNSSPPSHCSTGDSQRSSLVWCAASCAVTASCTVPTPGKPGGLRIAPTERSQRHPDLTSSSTMCAPAASSYVCSSAATLGWLDSSDRICACSSTKGGNKA